MPKSQSFLDRPSFAKVSHLTAHWIKCAKHGVDGQPALRSAAKLGEAKLSIEIMFHKFLHPDNLDR